MSVTRQNPPVTIYASCKYLARRANQLVFCGIACPAPFAKIFLFSPDPNQFTDSRRLVPTRGAIARRHERGTGCGGRESVRRAMAIAGRDEPRERSAACKMIGAFCVR